MASLASLVTIVGADLIMADWKSEPTSHLPFRSYLASLLLVGVGFPGVVLDPKNSPWRFRGPRVEGPTWDAYYLAPITYTGGVCCGPAPYRRSRAYLRSPLTLF